MVNEICKPKVGRPFTTVIYRYSERGDSPIFTDVWISKEWGSTTDIQFLSSLWSHLHGPDTDFPLDDLLDKATDACLPSNHHVPRAEPHVYRRTLEQVVRMMCEREHLNMDVECDYEDELEM